MARKICQKEVTDTQGTHKLDVRFDERTYTFTVEYGGEKFQGNDLSEVMDRVRQAAATSFGEWQDMIFIDGYALMDRGWNKLQKPCTYIQVIKLEGAAKDKWDMSGKKKHVHLKRSPGRVLDRLHVGDDDVVVVDTPGNRTAIEEAVKKCEEYAAEIQRIKEERKTYIQDLLNRLADLTDAIGRPNLNRYGTE